MDLAAPIGRLLDRQARAMLDAPCMPRFDFAGPAGEPALVPADSVSWRVFANPVALFAGGVAAVVLELAEPAVRTAVWEGGFRADPVGRLRRTGLAAMATVYGARGPALAMIAGVNRAHARVSGRTPEGDAFRASDPELLRWVQATAIWGFSHAYSAYAAPLDRAALDRVFDEGQAAARAYGVVDPPASLAEWRATLEAMLPRLEPSPVVGEFLEVMRDAPAFPRALRPVQRLMVRGAVSIVPPAVRAKLGLGRSLGLRPGEGAALRRLGVLAGRVPLPSSPPAQALRRLGLPADFLRR